MLSVPFHLLMLLGIRGFLGHFMLMCLVTSLHFLDKTSSPFPLHLWDYNDSHANGPCLVHLSGMAVPVTLLLAGLVLIY